MTTVDSPAARLARAPAASRFRSGARPSLWILAAAILVTMAALAPLAFVLSAVIDTGWSTAMALLIRPRVGELLINTVLLALLTLPLSITLAVALAWLTERSDLPGRRAWSLLAAAPLAVPSFVHSYAWISFVPSLHGLFAGVLVSVLAYFSFLYLPIAAALRRLDPAYEDVAASLAVPPWRIFFRVVLPQLRLAILGGSLLVGLHLLAEYGLYAMIRFDTFTTAIFDQFQSTFSGPAANMLASVLVLCCLAMLGLEARSRGHARYARLGAGSARLPSRHRLGAAGTALALLLTGAVALLSLGVPLAILLSWLMSGGAAIWRTSGVGPAFLQTLLFAAAGALITSMAAFPIAWLSVRAPNRAIRLLEGCNYVAGSLPGIVVALALVTITVQFARPLYQTVGTLLLGYLILFLPRAALSLRASIAQSPVELENVARSLGRSPLRAVWAVTARLAAPGAAAGAAMVFLAITNELTATLLLAPNGTRTLATGFWALSSELDYAGAAPYAVVMVLLSLPTTWLLYQQSRRTVGR